MITARRGLKVEATLVEEQLTEARRLLDKANRLMSQAQEAKGDQREALLRQAREAAVTGEAIGKAVMGMVGSP